MNGNGALGCAFVLVLCAVASVVLYFAAYYLLSVFVSIARAIYLLFGKTRIVVLPVH